jgi:hypothetical protein
MGTSPVRAIAKRCLPGWPWAETLAEPDPDATTGEHFLRARPALKPHPTSISFLSLRIELPDRMEW